ncbi:hypothetical protein [Streptomyces rhizosphaerihabitans]|uniref:hypothetical protein n=1 Tax=Streptomyces rhizosphaerihabitans TaxID=1266770 RepID=UPI0021BFE0FA|nr:hypothetical protein [Streptomyces rhizosphaerihabitans]MCT9008312.1 hypothetical protein [Streptomyces rhizosphaerihabitans]
MSGLTYFGAEAAAELQRWQNNRRKVTFAEALPDGGSGARLAFFYHEGDQAHPQQKLLLKLCADDEGADDEPRDLEEAWHSGPAFHRGARTFTFPERRLIPQVYPPLRVGGTWLMFLEVALDERARHPLVPLATVQRGADKAQVAAAVTDALLSEWNPDPRADHDMAAQSFLRQALGHRADPGSHLARATGQFLGSDLHNTTVELPGWPRPLPNPTPFADPSPLAGLKPPTVALGRAHYDLHPGNIMVAVQPAPAPDSFRLVDLSRFTDSGLLLRDLVHLMLCLICDYLPELGQGARTELTEILLDQDEDTTDPGESLLPAGLLSTLRLLRSAPDSWRRARRYAHPDWHPQYLLALQACALMFLTRRAEPEEQRWFLRLAAGACEAFQLVAVPHHESRTSDPGRQAARSSAPDETTADLPATLAADLERHGEHLRHIGARCADPRFDGVLGDNLRVVVNRCTALVASACDGPMTEATLAFHEQCTQVLQAAHVLGAAQDAPGSRAGAEKEKARGRLVAALGNLLEHPGLRSDARPDPEPEPVSRTVADGPRPRPAPVPRGLDNSRAPRPPGASGITLIDSTHDQGPSESLSADQADGPAADRARIALWGPPRSGKTTYLSALPIAAMQHQRHGKGTWLISGTTAEANTFLNDGVRKLAVERVFPEATLDLKSMGWRFRGLEPLTGRRKGFREARFLLEVQDAPGEKYREADSGAVDQLARSQGLIYLYDQLGDAEAVAPDLASFFSTLNSLYSRVEEFGGHYQGRLPHHLAVCIAKFDDPEVLRPAVEAGWVTQDDHGSRLPRVPGHLTANYFQWLCNDARNPGARMVRDGLETYFHPERVAYYTTSSIGYRLNPHHTFDYRDFANVAELNGSVRISTPPEPVNVLEPLTDLERRIRRTAK